MKLLYMSENYSPHDYRFLASFQARGYHVTHVRTRGKVLDSRRYPQGISGIEWREERTRYGSDRACMCGLVEALRPDIILAGPVQQGTSLAVHADRPVVAMSWGTDMLVKAEALPEHTSAILTSCAGAFGDCNAVRRAFMKYGSFQPDQVVVFPWGLDWECLPERPIDAVPTSETGKPITLISTRSWEEIYDIDVILRAVAKGRSNGSNFRLILLGDGSLRPMIETLMDDLQLHDCIECPGRLPNEHVLRYFLRADIYIAATRSDGSSVSLLEAMAHSLPCIVTDTEGNREWIEPEEGGLLYPVSDTDALAACLGTAMAWSESRRSAIGRHNYGVVRERADWRRNFDRLPELLEAVA